MKHHLRLLILGLLVVAFVRAQEGDGLVDDEEEIEQPIATAKEEYYAPTFNTPSVDKNNVYFVDWFEDLKGIGKHWFKSTAKKEGAEESLAKYNGEWQIGSPSKIAIENDYGLIVKTKARHHAIAAKLRKPFDFTGKPLVVQYEVKYEEGQECGGGYVKLLSVDANEKVDVFHDKTPYTIMFGPDKCGMTSKVHFIIRLTNPKNGTVSEHHAKQPSKSLSTYFEDKATHLYTLVITPDNTFTVMVDHETIISGNMLTDLEPSVVPPNEIPDPEDKKPADWDDREFIVDPEATKPEDWDESAPKEILDEAAVKPSDWLEEEEALIPDPTATKPEDWDEEVDGEWEAKKIANPACQDRSGCGKWTRPMKANPAYKGKWSAPKITNPAYKGRWSARLIENPHFFEANPYKQLAAIGAVGFELWTMSSAIIFDNILIADDTTLARDFARETFDIKVTQEKLFDSIANPTKGLVDQVLEATEERPWLWAVFVLAVLVPVILISVFCFGKKSPSVASHPKKTDEVQMDDPEEEKSEGEAEVVASSSSATRRRSSGNVSEEKNEDKSADEQASGNSSQKEEAAGSSGGNGSASPAAPTRRTRVRRD